MPRPERRRRGDVIAAAVIAVLAVAAAVLVWRSSESLATGSEQAPPGAQLLPALGAAPAAVAEVWRAPSAATPQPVVAGPSVVTADGSEVAGRDPTTGQVSWRYARDLSLCTVGASWGRAVAMYQRGGFCSEVTALDGATGARAAQRSSDATPSTRLLDNGTLAAAAGPQYVEVWRSDLVETLEYGAAQAPPQPGRQPRAGCRYGSFALVTGRLGVLEHCPGEANDRLTVLVPDGKEADRPEEEFSVLLPAAGARLVTLSADRVAVAAADPPRLLLVDTVGAVSETIPLAVAPAELAGDPPGGVAAHSADARREYWWTGSQTVALDRATLRPVWTVPGTLGPGVPVGPDLVVPVPGGLLVVDPNTGAGVRTIAVDRAGYAGPVGLGTAGPMLLEQRGRELVALRGA